MFENILFQKSLRWHSEMCLGFLWFVARLRWVIFVSRTKVICLFCELYKRCSAGICLLKLALWKYVDINWKKTKRCYWFTLSSQTCLNLICLESFLFFKHCVVSLIGVFSGVEDHYRCDWCVFGVCVSLRICNRSFNRLLFHTHTHKHSLVSYSAIWHLVLICFHSFERQKF